MQDFDNQIFLEKRPEIGIWGGLWSFPEFSSYEEAQLWCQKNSFSIQLVKEIKKQRHTFSHYHLDYTVNIVKIENLNNNVMEANQSVWYKIEQVQSLGLPAPIKTLIYEVVYGENS